MNRQQPTEDYPTHIYIHWETGEVLGFNMKDAAAHLGVGSTRFRTNIRNRYICKVPVANIAEALKAIDTACPTTINSANYDPETIEKAKQ